MAYNRDLEILTWQEVQKDVARVNPELAQVIDAFSPSDHYKIIKARYRFGDLVLNKDHLHLPYKGKLYPIGSKELPGEIDNNFSYSNNSMPVGLTLNKMIELYVEENNTVIPHRLFPPNKIFGLWNILGTTISSNLGTEDALNITAGSHSLYLLSKVSENRGFARLKKAFSLETAKPRSLSEQWQLFKTLARHEQSSKAWELEVLFFSKTWFEEKKTYDWLKFKYFLLQTGWRHTEHLRNNEIFKLSLSRTLNQSNLKPNPYTIDIINHLYAISAGFYPGLAVAAEESAPIAFLQQAMVDIYGLQNVPLFFSNQYFNMNHPKPAYYSLQFPALMEFSPKSREASNIVNMVELHDVLQTIISHHRQLDKRIQDSPLYSWANRVHYDFFHTSPLGYEKVIQRAINTPAEDQKMQQCIDKFPSLSFNHSASFFRGCVRISV